MVTYINNKNEFDPIVYVIFSMSSQLWGLGNKPSNLVGYLLLQTGKNIMEFYICSLHLHRKIHLMQEKTCRTSTPPRRYIWIFPNYSHFNDAIFNTKFITNSLVEVHNHIKSPTHFSSKMMQCLRPLRLPLLT